MKFSDEEWRELISSMGLRVHICEGFKKVITTEEKAALSQLHRRGIPKPPPAKTEKLVMHPRITSFFSKGNVLALPDDSVQHDIDRSIPLDSVSIVSLTSLKEFIQYLMSKNGHDLLFQHSEESRAIRISA